MDMEGQIRQYIAQKMRPEDVADLSPEFRLIDRGILDSMGMFEVVAFVEDTFDVTVEDEDMVAENFETTGAIADLVSRKSN